MNWNHITASIALLIVGMAIVNARPQQQSNTPSERLFDLSSLFNRYPSYQRPIYGGNSGFGQFYPGSGGSGYGGYGGYGGQGGVGNYPGSGLGTNILGGGYGGSSFGNSFGSGGFGGSNAYGGYGGYGGFGGNGGLSSYNGYSNNNYGGQRNLGFGYYRGTDSYGFLPSRETNYYSGTGYRGYS